MVQVLFQEEALLDIEVPLFFFFLGEEEVSKYVETVSKPELDRYVDEDKKAEIDQYVETVSKSELDQYVDEDKKAEIDQYVETVSKPELDRYVDEDKKVEIDQYVTNKVNPLVEEAAGSATAAAGSAQEAATSAGNAAGSAQEAATSAQEAATSAQEAATSAQNAATSESNAAESEAECQSILQRMGTVIKIKGRVDTLEDLPTSGNLDGDAYLVGPAGADSYPEYFWYLDHWEFMGTTATELIWGTIEGDISQQADLQAALEEYVSLSKDETISGKKIFSPAPGNPQQDIVLQNDLMNKEMPSVSTAQYAGYAIADANGEWLSYFRHYIPFTAYSNSIWGVYSKDRSKSHTLYQGYDGNNNYESNIVDTENDQTINGDKTFTGKTKVNIPLEANIGVATSSNDRIIEVRDSSNNVIGTLETNSNNVNDKYIALFAFDSTGANNGNLIIHYNNGAPYAAFSNNYTLANGDSSKKVATTDWAAGLRKSNTFTAANTFTGHVYMNLANDARIRTYAPNLTQGTAPASTQWAGIDLQDKNGVEMAECICFVDNNNKACAAQWVHSPKAGDNKSTFGVVTEAYADGTFATRALTPALNSNDTKIVTTNWFNQKIQVVSALPASPDGNVFYFVTG